VCDEITEEPVSRRALIGGGLALSGLFVLGCSPAGDRQAGTNEAAAAQLPPAPQRATMVVYRDPSCGCCKSWADIARKAGYDVRLQDDPDMAAVKKRLGVPDELASCHTASFENLVFEGHVPLDDVARLVANPGATKGIAVPGMPVGSPGMEVPEGTTQPFQVIAFDVSGKTSLFSTH
jgi:hypothetical protein